MASARFVFVVLCGLVCIKAWAEVVLPIEVHNSHGLIVRGEIGDKKNLRFLIDTGAVPSVLNLRVAKKLGLELHRTSASALAHTFELHGATLPRVVLGPIELQDHSVMITDLKDMEERFGTRIDFLAGLDILAHAPFTIDYNAKTLTFGNTAPAGVFMPYDWVTNGTAHYILVSFELNNRRLRLLLDTGARDIILFAARLPELASRASAEAEFTTVSAAQGQHVRMLPRARLKSAGVNFEQNVYFVEGGNTLPNFDGILGPAAIGLKRMSFDPQRKLLVFAIR